MKRAPKAMPALLVAFALNACAQPPAPSPNAAPEVSLAGKKLVLVNHEGRCALRKADASLLQLEMPWPCQLSPERDGGKPRVEQFNGAQIIIVSHVQPDPSQPGRCESQYQAVRQLGERLEPSILARGASCSNGPVDQKNFVGLFEW
ncbi:hypothetical protein C163_20430 [Pseudomonas sp. FGI182]|uniref:hypothetical protein n=1 Tax=Pseudomonas sp. FGI182 TaxID=1259844 RepID=UPI0003D87E00|nr:hypothetical protein [Pseudomonas sp. FGI182]AHD16007.1 hypothetical protein C163_20430 [Pseudomonas sp. FGI182]